ncbi:hypothetical protein SUGI_0610550 [Cryptomeria japonica]|nr:hypothetical protein SUGI_0610550 [Cryptomeria japonica]
MGRAVPGQDNVKRTNEARATWEDSMVYVRSAKIERDMAHEAKKKQDRGKMEARYAKGPRSVSSQNVKYK